MVTRFLFRILGFLLVPLMAALGTLYLLRRTFVLPMDPTSQKVKLVEVAPGKTFKDIAKELEKDKLVRNWWSLSLLARVSKRDTTIKAGEYEFTAAMAPKDVLKKLLSGEIYKRAVIVPEGISVFDVGKIVEEAGLLPAADFTRSVEDLSLLSTAGIKGLSFEGYLSPGTYFFSRPVTPKDIIWRMLEEGDKHWLPEFTDRANQLNLSRQDVLTLASIIEKESSSPEEQALISSVFHNRLNQGMRLQSDPTVIYGIKDFSGTLTKDDLMNPHPFNTYINFGLPPGPISNPGEGAIRAALYPKETNYLFFVGNRTGQHIFSSTLQEHNEAVARYQLSHGEQIPSMTESEASPVLPNSAPVNGSSSVVPRASVSVQGIAPK